MQFSRFFKIAIEKNKGLSWFRRHPISLFLM